MKLLITSPDALYDKETGEEFPGIFDALDHFLNFDENNAVVVVSIDKKKLSDIDKKYNPTSISYKFRGSPKLVEILTKHLGCTYSDVIVLGCKDHDVYTASNSKTLLLRATYAKKNEPTSIIYARNYGLRINSPKSLYTFFNHYFNIKTPWFYKLQVDDDTTLYALTEANTINKSKDYRELCEEFKGCLKQGNDTYLYPFTVYFLISTYLIFKDISSVSYWALYPSSIGDANDDLEFFLKKARQSYGGKNKEPLFSNIIKLSLRVRVIGLVIYRAEFTLVYLKVPYAYSGQIPHRLICSSKAVAASFFLSRRNF